MCQAFHMAGGYRQFFFPQTTLLNETEDQPHGYNSQKDFSTHYPLDNEMMFREDSKKIQRGVRRESTEFRTKKLPPNRHFYCSDDESEEESSRLPNMNPTLASAAVDSRRSNSAQIDMTRASSSQDSIMSMLQQMSLMNQGQFSQLTAQAEEVASKMSTLSQKVDGQLSEVSHKVNIQIQRADHHVEELSSTFHQRIDEIATDWNERMGVLGERIAHSSKDVEKRFQGLTADITRQLGEVTRNVNTRVEQLSGQLIAQNTSFDDRL